MERIIKADLSHKTITFAVLVPDVLDRNGQKISKDEIIKTAHEFGKNMHLKKINLDHTEEKVDGASFVETYVTLVDTYISKTEFIPKGTWCVGIKFDDEKLFEDFIQGNYVGVSMEGFGNVITLD